MKEKSLVPNTDKIEAAVFRRLLEHLDGRKDAQNIDPYESCGFLP